MTAIAYTLTQESVTIIHEGRPHTIQSGMAQFHMLRSTILTAIQTNDWDPVISSLTAAGSLMQYLGDRWSVNDQRALLLDGNPVPASIVDRIWRMANNGESPQPLFRFYERLSRNPSWRSVQQLFGFLQHQNIPLEEDGRFLAYKAVTSDFKDVHTQSIDNHPGVTNRMDRNLVSDDPSTACHYGYHVGALGYASTFHSQGELVICRVDPEHVVCVPHDHSAQKMRVCEYEVVGMYSGIPMSSDIHKEELAPDEEGAWRPPVDGELMVDDENEMSETDQEVADAEAAVDGGDNNNDETDPSGNEEIVDGDSPTNELDLTEIDDDDGNHNPDDVNDAAFERQLKVKASKAAPAISAKNKAAIFRRMNAKRLMTQSIEDLRAYAGHTLKIVGASKIPGGKGTLVAKILKIRAKK